MKLPMAHTIIRFTVTLLLSTTLTSSFHLSNLATRRIPAFQSSLEHLHTHQSQIPLPIRRLRPTKRHNSLTLLENQKNPSSSTPETEIIPNTTLSPETLALNAALLILCFGYAIYTILDIDHGMTRGWTQTEILTRIPFDNWRSYEESLSESPIFTKTTINVVIYLLGDWLSQTLFQGRSALDFDALRTLRNGFIGLCFGPIVHEYYEFSDRILPVEVGINRVYKILMDQSLYLSVKCSVYIAAVGVLNGSTLEEATDNVKEKIVPILFTAWKFWPLVHCVTYGFIPARHRILWVNCVDLIWNAILALKTSGAGDEEENFIEIKMLDETETVTTVVIDDESSEGYKIEELDVKMLSDTTINDDFFVTSQGGNTNSVKVGEGMYLSNSRDGKTDYAMVGSNSSLPVPVSKVDLSSCPHIHITQAP